MATIHLLFRDKDLDTLIRGYEVAIHRDVEALTRDLILGASEPDLIEHLVGKYTLEPPSLIKNAVYIDSQGETKIDVSRRFDYDVRDGDNPYVVGHYVTVAIPFEGDPDLFGFKPSTAYVSGIRGQVSGNTVLITFQDVKLDANQTKREIDSAVSRIEETLRWIKNDSDIWNKRVREIAETHIQAKKRRLLDQSSMVETLGLPIKRRDDVSATFSLPVTRRKRPVALPPVPKLNFKPEPALPEAEYDYILGVIDRLAITIERSASTFAGMEEEQIRDIILVDLNGHYEGDATGETFNKGGKTDILIRADGKNVFIAECKFWDGPKALSAAVDQILSYLTWRDTRASLIVFSKHADFTKVLAGVRHAIAEHPKFKRELKHVGETHFRYLFQQKDDAARDIYLAAQVFNIPRIRS